MTLRRKSRLSLTGRGFVSTAVSLSASGGDGAAIVVASASPGATPAEQRRFVVLAEPTTLASQTVPAIGYDWSEPFALWPKAELHAHLNGCVPPALFRDLLVEAGVAGE